jgi:hypothetical protein
MALDARSASLSEASSASFREKNPDRASGKATRRGGRSDASSIAEIRRLLQQEKFLDSKEAFFQLESLIGKLSLEAVLELLNDPEALADAEGDKYHLRHLIRSRLWQRFGMLAPEMALQKAFPEGKRTSERGVLIDDILYGVAKVDRGMAFEAWKTHFGEATDESFMSREPASFFAFGFFSDWSKSSPEAAFSALEGLGKSMQQDAYKGYVRSLATETDWQAELVKFDKLFPDAKDRIFSSQRAVCSLVSRWVLSDPDAAFAWVEALPKEEHRPAGFASFDLPGDGRADAYRQMIAAWMRDEPREAAEWLKNWKPPGNPDRFYAQIIQYRGSEDVAVSSTALDLISEQAVRDKVVRTVLGNEWQQREVLRMWENSPSLSPEVRAEVADAIRVRDEKGSGWTF